MNRRTYLASMAALSTATAAGCLGSRTDPPTSHMPKAVSIADVRRRTPDDVENVDPAERPTGLAFEARPIRPEITATAPARIALEYENSGSETLTLNVNPESPDPVHSEASDPGLILLSEAYDPTRSGQPCWKPREDGFPVPAVVYDHPIEPGESVTLRYDVWAAPTQAESCIAFAEYRFRPLWGAFSVTVEPAGG